MRNLINRESYLQTKTKQLLQWDRVIEKLISRADNTADRGQTEIRHHIIKIQVNKARAEAKLRKLQKENNGNWNDIKADFEKSWNELRQSFLKASTRSK